MVISRILLFDFVEKLSIFYHWKRLLIKWLVTPFGNVDFQCCLISFYILRSLVSRFKTKFVILMDIIFIILSFSISEKCSVFERTFYKNAILRTVPTSMQFRNRISIKTDKIQQHNEIL